MKFARSFIAIIIMLLIASSPLFAQGLFTPEVLNVNPVISVDKAYPGISFRIAIMVDIEPQYHINSHTPDEGLIKTELNFNSLNQISFGKVLYPKPHMVKFSFSDEPLSVYENKIVIYSTVTISNDHPLGIVNLEGTLSYQACDDNNCYAPAEEKFSVPIDIVDSGITVSEINEDVFKNFPALVEESIDEGISFSTEELRAKKILEKGLPYAIIAFFIFGLALNLTPCVYPVIPITVGYFGGQSERRKGSSFIIALFYVIGIAIVFAILGLISGLAGQQWGFLFQNPWFVVVISIIILAMAASMFGAFEITIPSWLMGSLGKSREGVLGSLIMGLTVGIVIAPCAAGIIIGLVGLVAKLGIVAKGALLFFIMGLGLGLPYLILATFSGLLNKLPQSGMWMIWIKKLFGILLVGVALYFLMPQVKAIHDQLGFLLGVLIIFGGLLLGFLDHAPGYTKRFNTGRAILGVLVILFGIITTNKAIHSEASKIDWINYSNQSVQELTVDNKPVLVDFYADWCTPCKEMDAKTFSQEIIIEKSKSFNMVKVDLTTYKESTEAFKNKFNISGMPTFIFLNSNGQEIKELRTIGYAGYEEFLPKMEQALDAN